jgi:excinuclease ABC subunit C
MREIITRRLNRLKDWGTPDLILIDGGEPQLRAIADILDATSIPYIGLIEGSDTVILPKNYQAVSLPRNSHIVKLLQRIRDESHRFAVQYHTLLKRKAMLK